MTRRPPNPWAVLNAVLVHLVLTAVVWRDIDRREPSKLRGSPACGRC